MAQTFWLRPENLCHLFLGLLAKLFILQTSFLLYKKAKIKKTEAISMVSVFFVFIFHRSVPVDA